MSRRTIVAMPGDGIGRHVIPEALRVLDASGFDADVVTAEIGWACWLRDGEALPRATIELLDTHELGLLGAITSKPPAQAEAELPASLHGRGLKYASPILELRRRFQQDICVRPCVAFPGNPTNFVRRRADGSIDEPPIEIVVFRQNTEGLYAGVEWTDPPATVRDALATHPRFAPFETVPGRDLALTVRIVTREASRRIVDAAFRYAAEHGVRQVTVAEKPNVLRETSGLFEEAAREVQRHWPDIMLQSSNVDALLLGLVRKPEDYRVIVASNLFGDLVSDAAAGLTGGLGFACSANVGARVSIFEPTHGSAPKHAGSEPAVVNPCGAILAAALLAEHAGDAGAASRIRAAVAAVVASGAARTFDMSGSSTTRQMADAIVSKLGRS
jgi:3-isopropylmalate dehydrogenase